MFGRKVDVASAVEIVASYILTPVDFYGLSLFLSKSIVYLSSKIYTMRVICLYSKVL